MLRRAMLSFLFLSCIIKRSTYVDACDVRLVSWSMELLEFASHLLEPKMLDRVLHVIPFHSSL